jgi:hypothetical protein
MRERKIPASAIESLQRVLGDAPERRPGEFNQKEAVRLLFPEIRAMQTKGYSISEIAQVLSERGVEVTASSLRTLLSIFQCAAEKRLGQRALRDAKESRGPLSSTSVDRPASVAKQSPERSPGHVDSSGALLGKERKAQSAHGAAISPAVADASKRSSTSTAAERIARPGTFIPREDTDEI